MKANKVLRTIWMLLMVISINFVSSQTKTVTPIQKNGKWGFADESGVVIIACEYEKVAPFKNGLAVVYNNCVTFHPYGNDVATHYRECKEGIINSQGKLVVPIEYASIGNFNEKGIAKAYRVDVGSRNKKVGYIEKTGKEIMPFIYNESSFFRGGGFSKLFLDGKVGLLSKEGEIVIPVHYDEIKATDKYVNYPDIPSWAIIQIRLGNKWGFYDPINKKLVEPQFDGFFRHPGYHIDETEQFLFTNTGEDVWLWNKANGKKVYFGKYNALDSIKTDNLIQYFQ